MSYILHDEYYAQHLNTHLILLYIFIELERQNIYVKNHYGILQDILQWTKGQGRLF